MKRIYTILLVAIALSIGSCDIESNARYTGNYYSANTPKEQQNSTAAAQPKAEATQVATAPGSLQKPVNASARGYGGRVTN